MDPIAGLLPGLMENFPQAQLIDGNALQLSVDQHLDTLLQAQSGSADQALHFVTSLPCLAPPEQNTATKMAKPELKTELEPEPEPEQQPVRVTATHLLRNAIATALSPDGSALGQDWQLYFEQEKWLLRGAGTMVVNGKDYVTGQALHCGDSLEWGTQDSASLIAVETP